MISILFSPKPFVGNDAANQRNALASWRREVPDAELICYGDAEGVADACRDFGAVLVKEIPFTQSGAPRFDWIVHHAALHAKCDLQMFINADIFLMPGFCAALARIPFPQFLAVSDRLNVPQGLLSESPLANARSTLLDLIESGEAEMNGGTGSDFFIFRRGMWNGLPPVAAGRAGYDNVLMWHCLKNRHPLIDVTNAILPLHPKHNYNHVAGGKQTVYGGPDVELNMRSMHGLTSPFLCDATHLLLPDDVVCNHRFHGFPHRWLAWTHARHPRNYLMRFFARSIHFSVTRLGIARPKKWNCIRIVNNLALP